MGRVLAVACLTALLGGCLLPPPPEQGLVRGWAPPMFAPKTVEHFCYGTLAEVDCHARLLSGEENRRIGFFDAAVAD